MKAIKALLTAGILFGSSAIHQQLCAAEAKSFQGVWVGAVMDGDGSQPNATRTRISELVITADKITAKDDKGSSLGEGTYKVDLAKGTIDTTGVGGRVTGKSYPGIISLNGDTLKWCSATPGKQRPGEFKTHPPEAFLMVLQRKKQ